MIKVKPGLSASVGQAEMTREFRSTMYHIEDLEHCLARIRNSLCTESQEEKISVEEQGTEYLSEKRMAEKMVQYIIDRYSDVSLQMLGEEFCLGTSDISSIIKRNTGKNYNDHLLDIRISKAQELLHS